MKNHTRIKVDKSFKEIHFSMRKQIDLIVEKDYFVSFGDNFAYHCKLKEVLFDREKTDMVRIETAVKIGNVSNKFTVFADELGATPEESVINCVTS